MHIAEKYSSLARDAMSSGDSVAAENYLQHAEHYNRIILAAQAQNMGMPGAEHAHGMNGGGRFQHNEPFQRDFDAGDDDLDGDDLEPQQRSFPERQERPAYNPNQPQPFIPQNAFPHIQPNLQPAAPVSNGNGPFQGEGFAPAEGQGRRRRRRPMGDHNKGFNGQHGGPSGPVANGVTQGGGDNSSEDASS
jgi:Domain of unknown function (DUF4167)